MGLVRIGQVMRKSRLRWYGHVARREETHWLQRILNFPVAGKNPRGRPRKTWEGIITEDRRASNITHRGANPKRIVGGTDTFFPTAASPKGSASPQKADERGASQNV